MRSTDLEFREFNRTTRYTQFHGSWYFRTREGDFLGPYNSVVEVVEAEKLYIALLKLNSAA